MPHTTVRRWVLVLAILLPTFAPGVAGAGAAAKLTYLRGSGAERCAEEEELRKAVAARVGYDLFFPWAQKTVVVEVSTAQPSGYRGVVKIVDDQGRVVGQRSINSRSDDCADLIGALALAISIAVDDRTLEYVPPEPTVSATPPDTHAHEGADAPPEPVDAGPARPAAAPTHALSLAAWATPLVALQSAPSPAVGIESAAVVRFGSLSLELGARIDAPASTSVAAGGSVSTWQALATLAPCWHGPLGVWYCGLVEGGWLTATGQVPVPGQAGEPVAAAGLRIAFDVPLSARLFFVSHLDGLAALTRFDVLVGDAPVFHVPAVATAFGAGLGLVL